MTNSKLNFLDQVGDLLSREELKKILGGDDVSTANSMDQGEVGDCARYSCGLEAKPCCSPSDECSGADKYAVCRKRA